MFTRTAPVCFVFSAALFAPRLHAAELKVFFPQNRTAFQTNETIDVAVLRSDAAALPAGDLVLNLSSALIPNGLNLLNPAGDVVLSVPSGEGSRLAFTFPLAAVPVVNAKAISTEHFHVNGRLLRPGMYTIEVAAAGATAKAEIEVLTHLRRSSFRLVNWGRADKPELQLPQGEQSLGYNLYYTNFNDEAGNLIRAGVDNMANCVMSGGHQMDLRLECDWSDPYVTRGGTQRAVRRAFVDRTRPNIPGVHFYDEPGLTWGKDGSEELTPHAVAPQHRAYEAAFGKPPLRYDKVDPSKPRDVADWKHWATWKLGFMDSAWKEAGLGISTVRPDYLSVTQSQYGWSAFTDGYYFNVVRSMPVVSGHGGYDDYGGGYFNPSYTLEMSRARNFSRTNWYLPTWYGSTPTDRFRMEQYLSFMTDIQGMITPPDIDPALRPLGMQGVVESNHLMARLGTIFTTMKPTPGPVAMLYSLSAVIDTQTKDRSQNYAHSMPHGQNLAFTYLAGKVLQQPFTAVLDEDVLDGSLAMNHKALILTSIDFLDAPVVKSLEDFIAGGGLVLKTSDCKVQVSGAVDLGVTPAFVNAAELKKLADAKDWNTYGEKSGIGVQLESVKPYAAAIKAQLDKAGIGPIFTSSNREIVATRQAAGDVEYLFAVNATFLPGEKDRNAIHAAFATIGFNDNRPTYDAVRGGPVTLGKNNQLDALRFGPGQMRVFARTARPLGSVRAATPILSRDLTLAADPISVQLCASVLDTASRLVSGSIPLQITVTDPLGVVRYDLFRATTSGSITLTLPLAANDPAGDWKVTVRELLANNADEAAFHYQPARRCGAIAGGHYRALRLPEDDANIFRFAREHHDVTLVVGSGDFNGPAAERLKKILEPWGVRCTVVKAADAAKSRPLTAAEAPTWIGLDPSKATPDDKNPPQVAGFALNGPAILLGNAADNPLIDFIQKSRFLPYAPVADEFPGRGRGFIAWQRDAIGKGQESVTLIAFDAGGMAEAVGSAYEAVSGMEPLMRWQPAASDSLIPATRATLIPAAPTAWRAVLNDRIVGITVEGKNLGVLSADGFLTTIGEGGKIGSTAILADLEYPAKLKLLATPPAAADAKNLALPRRMVKHAVTADGLTAASYWGGTLQILDAAGTVKYRQLLPQDITALAWSGRLLLVGLADGQLIALEMK
jgi:hypothetical protein